MYSFPEAPMAIPTRAYARETFSPYHGLIWRLIQESWDEWRLLQRLRADHEMPPLLYRRTIANYMFDAIARRAIPAFGAEERVLLDVDSQTFKIFVGGIVARFKKGGDDKLGSSIPTQTALAFMEADGVLPGMPREAAKVEIIWLPNEIWTQIEQILVVARDGDELIWEYEIEAADSADIVPLPIALAPKGPEGADDLVKPKVTPGIIPKKQ